MILRRETIGQETDNRLVAHIGALIALLQHSYAPLVIGTETIVHIVMSANLPAGDEGLMAHQHTVLKTLPVRAEMTTPAFQEQLIVELYSK